MPHPQDYLECNTAQDDFVINHKEKVSPVNKAGFHVIAAITGKMFSNFEHVETTLQGL